MARVSESAVAAARDLRVVFSRLSRRLLEVATDEDLTPSQTAVLIRLVKDGSASTVNWPERNACAHSRWPPRWPGWTGTG
jgi:hypothetical protein